MAGSTTTIQDMTIEEYLRGKVGFDVEDSAIISILADRKIELGALVTDLTTKQKRLCTADLYMWCASTPSKRGSVKDADGNWSHEDGGTESSAFDKRNLRAMAKDIYKVYGEYVAKSSIKLSSSGIKVWQ